MAKEKGFSFKNTEEIAKEINVAFTKEQAIAKQKFCNVCHTGCLDCHYQPDPIKGVHHFSSKPSSQTCGGYGRNSSMCHAGSLHSRRGGTYVGGDYSIPIGMPSDTHFKKDITCIDCHITGSKGMGDMQRTASCQDCHIEIENVHSRSIHKDLYCSACHINEARGYQIVVYGPGLVAGKPNPFKKYSLYHGIQSPPILMKDQKNKWMAVKVFPHSVGNFKIDVKPSDEIKFRWKDPTVKDAYYIIGTESIGNNDKHLLWLEIQQISHPYGKSRKCDSCHQPEQISLSTWHYEDEQGVKETFSGGYKIVANKEGLKIIDMKTFTPIKISKGYKLEDFASWLFFKDKWQMPGNFSIKTEKEKYLRYLKLSQNINRELKYLATEIKNLDKKTQKKFKELKAVTLHNEDEALRLIEDFKKSLR
ncbi:MAG: cytochrome c3 family protein [Thermodesulfovibrionales bacterium]|nr:cytochrome c3 family protein [Thermodesulfovibrionales bacterium]